MRPRDERRWQREVKAWRRIKEDRQQHGQSKDCPCFGSDDRAAWGRTFSRFADTPKACSCVMCGNARSWNGELSLDERIAHNDYVEQCAELSLPRLQKLRRADWFGR